MKVFVTGANGLLGQHLIRQLVDEGKFVIHATGKDQAVYRMAKKTELLITSLILQIIKKHRLLLKKFHRIF